MKTFVDIKKDKIKIQVQPENAHENELIKNIDLSNLLIFTEITEHNKFNHGKEYWLEIEGRK